MEEQNGNSNLLDRLNTLCHNCPDGTYKNTLLSDDMDGTLHCDKCGDEIKRWKKKYSEKPGQPAKISILEKHFSDGKTVHLFFKNGQNKIGKILEQDQEFVVLGPVDKILANKLDGMILVPSEYVARKTTIEAFYPVTPDFIKSYQTFYDEFLKEPAPFEEHERQPKK